MENLYIQIIDGKPVNHPAYESNLREAFNQIPADWERFMRIQPQHGIYQVCVYDQIRYEKIDGFWTDVYVYRDMTEEEKELVQKPVKAAWASNPFIENFSAWSYDEELNKYVPPFPRPLDAPEGQMYRWCGAEGNWKLASQVPNDGKIYYFDFNNWIYVEAQNGPNG